MNHGWFTKFAKLSLYVYIQYITVGWCTKILKNNMGIIGDGLVRIMGINFE